MSAQRKVEKLLAENPKLRDSDLALLGAYWASEGFVMTNEQKVLFMTLTTPETITRIRRALRSKYPGSDVVEKERFNKYIEYTNDYGERVMRAL